jgi:hypothetical protein
MFSNTLCFLFSRNVNDQVPHPYKTTCNSHFFLEWKMFERKTVQKIKTHVLCLIAFFFFSRICAVYEIMWNSTVQPGGQKMIIWRMRIVCWIPQAKHTHTQNFEHFCFSTATVVARKRLNVTAYLYCLSRYILILVANFSWSGSAIFYFGYLIILYILQSIYQLPAAPVFIIFYFYSYTATRNCNFIFMCFMTLRLPIVWTKHVAV